jgi:hypothetical protein
LREINASAPRERTIGFHCLPEIVVMTFDIPHSLKAEHEQLHATLADAAREAGDVGASAREVARLLHPHFVHEEEFALPPLALLEPIARGGVTPDMASVLPMTKRLKEQLPQMLREHAEIVAGLERLVSAAREAGLTRYERFGAALVLHAQTEEQVLYPAAILVGERVERDLAPLSETAAATHVPQV